MTPKRPLLSLALVAGMALAAPGGALATEPVAHGAGGDAAPLTPAVVGVPIARTGQAIDAAADAPVRGRRPPGR